MSRAGRLVIVLALNLALIAALVTVGLAAHSLAVLAAGADYLADAAAIGVSLLAIRLAARPPTAARPHGYPAATKIAALVNAGWLLVLNILIAVAAVQHLAAGARRVEGVPVLIVSSIAAAVMLAGALILGGDPDNDDDGGEDLNIKAVLLDTAADAAGAAGVAVSGAVIAAAGGLYWLDPAIALLIALIVGYHAQKLIRKIISIVGQEEHLGFGAGDKPVTRGRLPRPLLGSEPVLSLGRGKPVVRERLLVDAGALNIEVRRERDVVVVEVSGDVDLSTVGGLREQLSGLAGTGQTLIVDLNRVTFIDSAGLGALVGAYRQATGRGGSLYAVCSRPQTRRLLWLTGVDRRIPLAATIDGALMLLAASRKASDDRHGP